MSVFDLFDNKFLPGDKTQRRFKSDVLEYEHFSQDTEGIEIFKEHPKPLFACYLVLGFCAAVLIFQLLRLQIAQGSFNQNLAEGNRVRVRQVAAPRGLIYDSEGKILVQNSGSFNLEVYPLDIPRSQEERNAIFEKLSEVSQIPKNEIEEKVKARGYSSYDPIILKENLDRETAMIMEYKTVNLAGVVVSKNPIRQYTTIPGMAQITGYVGKMTDEDLKDNPNYQMSDQIGKMGLESTYEKYLRGTPGITQVEVDSRGRQQRQLQASTPELGNSLTLSINARLEKVMADSLSAQVAVSDSPGGAAIAMNPQNGQILGMVSIPTFDNNIFTSVDVDKEYQKLLTDPAKPMFNRAVSGIYPSGSIIKPVIAASALQEKNITENTSINDTGEIRVGNYVYPDWKAHGIVDVRKAIAVSANVFFYAIAGGWDKISGLGIEKLDKYLSLFGFGAKTGIDIPGEAAGLVPSPDWKKKIKNEMWYLGDTYHLGIGQGDFLVTPLQMAQATSAVANGGTLYKPQIVSKIADKNGKEIQTFHPQIIRDKLIDNDNLQIVREGMRLAVTAGSATRLQSLPIDVAAKTGTAQFGNDGKTHAWMATFAPYKNPEIVVVVLVEEGGEGYATAGPVAQSILDWYFTYK